MSTQKASHCLVALLVMVAVYRYVVPISLPQSRLETLMPGVDQFQRISQDPAIWSGKKNGQVVGYLGLTQANGYGGPMSVATVVDTDGGILHVSILSHRDTAAFVRMLENQHYMERFKGIKVAGARAPVYDLDGISGATYS
ncbi:MAG: FMN-binding protein, partial [Desulfobacterales bacterium]|nr:FMN-binding protein [Desulfobacterales bacterium]